MIIMAGSAVIENSARSAAAGSEITPRPHQANLQPPRSEPADSWHATAVGLLLLVLLWAFKLYTTWGAWGDLRVDSGHEMYIPALLLEGKKLYRDVMFTYGPAAPYLTSYFYRLFGVNLNVLYWAGSLSALCSAIFLYLTGKRLSYWAAGWAAGAVVLMEAFHPSCFCFPLPYSSAAVYGCLVGCVFLWLVVVGAHSTDWYTMFAAGSLSALALMLKPEFGIACYGTLSCWLAARWLLWRSPRMLARDVASILPGLAACGVVLRWMLSIAGMEFITQENIQSWPSSYFMKTYGRLWLSRSGFSLSSAALLSALYRSIPVVTAILMLCAFLRWKRRDFLSLLLRAFIVVGLLLNLLNNDYFGQPLKPAMTRLLSSLFFPRDMVLYVAVAAGIAWVYFLWRPAVGRKLAAPLLLTFSGVLAFRVLLRMSPDDYAIYFNGPVVLSFLILLSLVVSPRSRSPRLALLVEISLCLACVAPAWVRTEVQDESGRHFVPLVTDRGTVRVPSDLDKKYALAIQFMKDKKALGQSVLSLPEDTSLYFLSGTDSPTRAYILIPGAVAPGKMTNETIAEINRKPVDYLLWSNRTFPEYGGPVFGRDFNQEVGAYLISHYRPVGPLAPSAFAANWNAVIWERKPFEKLQ